MNRKTLTYQGEQYLAGDPTITFRVSGTYSSSELCDGTLHLVYFTTKTREDGWEDYEFHELDFEINRQRGRPREMNLSTPLLALPWTVTHAIVEESPLYGLSLEDMAAANGEIIAVLDGIDEISSQNYQSRWSYIPREILSHREFLPCVRRDIGCFVVDFDKISHTVEVEEHQIVESAEVMDELAAIEDFQIVRAPKKYVSGPIRQSEPRQCYRRFKTENVLVLPPKFIKNFKEVDSE